MLTGDEVADSKVRALDESVLDLRANYRTECPVDDECSATALELSLTEAQVDFTRCTSREKHGPKWP